MCGRFNIIDNPAVHVLLDQLGIHIDPLPTRYNIAPTETVPVISLAEGIGIAPMRWWLTPHWSDGPSQRYAMFNARAETLATSRAFRGPFRYRRGIIPAASFIEWQKAGQDKQPWLVSNESNSLFFAVVWDSWQLEHLSCAMVTTASSLSFSILHSRQPLVLTHSQSLEWLNPDLSPTDVQHLLSPVDFASFSAIKVAASVGNSRNKDAPEEFGDWVFLADLTKGAANQTDML